MNKDRIKGTIDEAAGSAKRKAGDLTGSTKLEVDGIIQQIEGKIQNAWGKAKDAVHDANQEAVIKHQTRIDAELERAAIEENRGNK